jgi:hypothetical protein
LSGWLLYRLKKERVNMSELKMYKMKMSGVNGAGYFMFKEGILRTLYYEFEEWLGIFLPQREKDIHDMKGFWNEKGVTFVELVPKTTEEKLALFCAFFKEKRGSGYTPKQNEKNNIKNVMVTEKLLQVYFSNQTYPLSYAKSVTDYIRHYNYIRDIEKNPQGLAQRPQSMPERPDTAYEKTLNGPALSSYREHMYKLGWRFNKDLSTLYNINERK